MSVRLLSFTVGRDGGWSCVTPAGIVTAERGTVVTVLVSDTWEEGIDAAKWATTKPGEEKSDGT